MKQRVAVVTGTRADFGLWGPVLRELADRPLRFEPQLLVMAMHLDERFGRTVGEVRRYGLPIMAEVACTPMEDTSAAMGASLGVALEGASSVLAAGHPDWLLVLGDRGEQLAAALAALHQGIAIAHLHGGERTAGAVDDTLRDLISRTAHLHLPATVTAGRRLIELGEEEWRIRVTGGPGIDAIRLQHPAPPDIGLRSRYGIGADEPYLLAIVHPETAAGGATPAVLTDALIAGLAAAGLPVIAIWPNADAGGRAIAERLATAHARLAALVPSVPHDDYLRLLVGAAALVGNSSSGIIEAPFLRVPAVNVGERQEGRERGDNVIDVPPSPEGIAKAVERATAPEFRARLTGRSPYGDGHAAARIVNAIEATQIDRRLLRKRSP